MVSSAQAPVLVARRVDGWLVGWLAVLVWVGAAVVAHTRSHLGMRPMIDTVYWVGVVFTAAHFGLSYHLAYRDGLRAVRRRSFALVQGPLLMIVALAGLTLLSYDGGTVATEHATSALITTVYVMTTWHYIKQTYGVGRVGAAAAGVALSSREVRVLRFGLYPLWLVGAAQVLVRHAGYGVDGFHVGFGLLPQGALPLLRAFALASALPIILVLIGMTWTRRTFPPAVLVAPYAAAFLWLGLPPSPVLTVLLLAPFHALQYLAIGHRAELATTVERPSLFWWLNIFVGAACGGLLLSRWLPGLLDTHLRAGDGRLLFTAAFFVFLNFHHYLIDAVIWRSKGELVKALVRRPAAAPPSSPVRAGPNKVFDVAH